MQSRLSDHCGIKLKINRKLLVPNVSLCWGMLIMGEIDDACVGAGGMWEISVPSPVFFSEPRTGLKNNPNLKIGILGIVSRVTCCQLLPE